MPRLTRFDTQALRPPALTPDASACTQRGAAPWAAVLAWCHQADGAAPQAVLAGHGAQAWAEALACQLDGSQRLAGLGRAAGLAWRLGLVLRETWARRHRDDPWDAGWPLDNAAGHDHLARHWWPRRPTLLLADAALAEPLSAVHQALAARLRAASAGPALPVRWLWVAQTMAAASAPAPTVAPAGPSPQALRFSPGAAPRADVPAAQAGQPHRA